MTSQITQDSGPSGQAIARPSAESVRPHVTIRALWWIVLAALCSAVSVACPGPTDPIVPQDAILIDARVVYTSIEGGCWYLETDDGAKYDAVPNAYRRRGLPVRAAVRLIAADHYCPGRPAEVVWIRLR